MDPDHARRRMRGLSDTPQVVLLVGGRGTRLRPLTDDLPKCLAPVGGRPFLEYVIELYARQGIRDLALCSGYLAERIVDAVGNGSRWGVTIQHSIEPAPLGTIGALRYAAAVLHETFVLSYGDIYPAMPVARLIEKSRTVEQPAVMTVAPADDGDTSIAHGRITAYEKGASAGTHSWTECGMLALERRLLFEHDSTDENGFYGRRAAPRTARHPPGIALPFPASRQPRVRRPAPRGRVPPGARRAGRTTQALTASRCAAARRALPCAISSSASGTLMGRLAKAVKVGVRAASAVSMWSSFISTGSARKFTTASVAPPL